MEAYVALPQWVVSTSTICIAGNYLYVWSPTTTGSYLHQTYLYDYGFRVHLDTLAYEYVKLTGTDKPLWSDEKAQTEGASIETVPCFFDGTRIRFWNYGVAADRDAFYAVNLTPTGGAGTAASPYTMAVTREQRSASGMPNPAFTYTVDYIPDWGVAMVLPHGGTRWWALRL